MVPPLGIVAMVRKRKWNREEIVHVPKIIIPSKKPKLIYQDVADIIYEEQVSIHQQYVEAAKKAEEEKKAAEAVTAAEAAKKVKHWVRK